MNDLARNNGLYYIYCIMRVHFFKGRGGYSDQNDLERKRHNTAFRRVKSKSIHQNILDTFAEIHSNNPY